MKILNYFIVGLSGLVVLGISGRALWVAMLPVHVIDNTIQTSHGVIDKTINADNAIYNYEWFKQQAEDIKALQNKQQIAQQAFETFKSEAGKRENWTFEDKTESARLAAVSQGLKNQLEDVVATYNARAKMANRNIFKDGIIPSAFEMGSNFLK